METMSARSHDASCDASCPALLLDDVSFRYALAASDGAESADSSEHGGGADGSPADAAAYADAARQAPCALSHINLSIERGDFLGIIGPSGAGKTTLACLFSGAIPHHYVGELSGTVQLFSRDTKALSLTDIARFVGLVMQDIDAQMVASVVEDELLFGLENFGVPAGDIPSRIEEALHRIGIEPLRNRTIATLSGGQKQKVALAAIIALKPSVLVLDEPTCALDPASSRTIYELLSELNRSFGITIIAIEQKVALLSEFCSHLAVLNAGSLAAYGTTSDVLSQIDTLDAIGISYPRTTRFVRYVKQAGFEADTPLCVRVDDTVHFASRIINSDPTFARAPGSTSSSGSSSSSTLRSSSKAGSMCTEHKPVVQFSHVSFSYPTNTYSLKDVSFEAYPSEILCLVGQNGAGKTTITKLINGLLKPCSGSVYIDGTKTNTVKTSTIARSVSTLFQNPDRMLSCETVLDEVMLSCTLVGYTPQDARERSLRVIHQLHLNPEANPFVLSAGQRHIVALAATIVTEPKVLILDEPTCGLDYAECCYVMRVVQDLRKRGCCVVMVCHDMEVVLDNATRMVVLADGELVAQGSISDIFSQDALCQRACLRPPLLVDVALQLSTTCGLACSTTYDAAALAQIVITAAQHNRKACHD
ncbi:ABC transporter, ATP-binding protein [Fannyhessea vaginae PB189-T1-4]|uniref:ABC transporter, ATP-binding protein n=1 Tax=Fannyhessea vaginae PB189-T1-4 TaxID=866774 RepID=A0ABN0B0B6_9ACTN|nr:ATP-binding cassette domain-containing protein [Fannyhessea vaginae]EFL44249.1 ABC transporter, ATP-binding protein [Fannyhessea vaginae PB189-T1-4]